MKKINTKKLSTLLLTAVLGFSILVLAPLSQTYAVQGGAGNKTAYINGVVTQFNVFDLKSTVSLPYYSFNNGEIIEIKYYKRDMTLNRTEYEIVSCPSPVTGCYVTTQLLEGDLGDAGYTIKKINQANLPVRLTVSGDARDFLVSGYLKTKYIVFAAGMPEYSFDGNYIDLPVGESVELTVKVLTATTFPLEPTDINWIVQKPNGISYQTEFVQEYTNAFADNVQIWRVTLTNNSQTGGSNVNIKPSRGTLDYFPFGTVYLFPY